MLPVTLKYQIANKKLSHAYLFYSAALADEFISQLNCLDIDISVLQTEKGHLHILTSDIEKLQSEIKFKPYGDMRLVYIKNAESMSLIVQNKLLKTLEEPDGNIVFVLVSKTKDALLPTVISRCMVVQSADNEASLDAGANSTAESFYRLVTEGAPYYILKGFLSVFYDGKDDKKEAAVMFLDSLELLFGSEASVLSDYALAKRRILLIEETSRNIQNSFSLSIQLKNLALNI